MSSYSTILGIIAIILPSVLSAGLSGLFGTGFVNFVNQKDNKWKWAITGVQMLITLIAVGGLILLKVAQETPTLPPQNAKYSQLPEAAALRNLLKKCILEDLQSDVIEPLEKLAVELDHQEKENASSSSTRLKVIAVKEAISNYLNDTRTDTRRWERSYIGDQSLKEFQAVRDLCNLIRATIVEDRLSTLADKNTIIKQDIERIIMDAQGIIAKFKLN